MTFFNAPGPEDDHKKWDQWSMRARKPRHRMTNYGSAFVLALSAIVTSGLHQQLIA